ncbi:MAG: type II toxin-antitoxin system PemK/MazF family toxin [Chloroflexota bacterium]
MARPVGQAVFRFEVYLVRLNPTQGSEIRKTRPCLVISPDEMNHHLRTVIIAPMTTQGGVYPSRVAVTFSDTAGQVVLDQIRTIDKTRLVRRLGSLDEPTAQHVLEVLAALFAP